MTHDYSKPRWGRAVEVLSIEDGGQWLRVAGFGRAVGVEDFLILPNRDGTTRYQVAAIEYKNNPPDMWFADLVFRPRPDVPRRDESAESQAAPIFSASSLMWGL